MPRPDRFGHMNRQHHSGRVQPAPRPPHPVENIDDQLKAIAHVLNKRDVRPHPRDGPLRIPQNRMQGIHCLQSPISLVNQKNKILKQNIKIN